EHFAQGIGHVRKPLWVSIRIGIQMIEEAILHHVETVGVRQRVIRLAQVPFSGEIGFVTALLKHRRERPLRLWQTAALALESHGGHAAAIRKAPRNHGSAPRRATWLGIEREER